MRPPEAEIIVQGFSQSVCVEGNYPHRSPQVPQRQSHHNFCSVFTQAEDPGGTAGATQEWRESSRLWRDSAQPSNGELDKFIKKENKTVRCWYGTWCICVGTALGPLSVFSVQTVNNYLFTQCWKSPLCPPQCCHLHQL